MCFYYQRRSLVEGERKIYPPIPSGFFFPKKNLAEHISTRIPPAPKKTQVLLFSLRIACFVGQQQQKKRPKKIITKWPSRNDLQPGTGYRGSLVGVRRLMMDKFSHVQRRQWKWCEGPNSVGEPSRILEVVSDRINQNTHEKKWIRSVCFFVCIFYIYM